MVKLKIKTKEEMEIMAEGGAKLGRVRDSLGLAVKPGVTAWEIEELARKLIKEEGAEGSFDKVPNYKWVTCVNLNDGVVHGIPKKEVVFKDDDIVSVDVGLFYKGFHTDTAISVYLGTNPEKKKFIEAGKKADWAGIKEVKKGKTIRDISAAIEKTLIANDLRPVWNLTGHGVGRDLHEEPNIPNFVYKDPVFELELGTGFVLAVEVMYTTGSGDIKIDNDGWTIRTKDAKIAALWEETVALTADGPVVLTATK